MARKYIFRAHVRHINRLHKNRTPVFEKNNGIFFSWPVRLQCVDIQADMCLSVRVVQKGHGFFCRKKTGKSLTFSNSFYFYPIKITKQMDRVLNRIFVIIAILVLVGIDP